MVTFYNRNIRPMGGGHYYEGIGSIYKTSRGLRGYGNLKHQFGNGFGSFLSKIFGKAVPFLKNRVLPALQPAFGAVKNALVDAATNIVDDVIQGENVATSVKKNITSEGKKLLARAPEAFAGVLKKPSTVNLDSNKPASQRVTPTSARKRKKVSFVLERKRPRNSINKFPGLSKF